MSSGVKKTNAMRMLDSAKIPYEVRTYEFEAPALCFVRRMTVSIRLFWG